MIDRANDFKCEPIAIDSSFRKMRNRQRRIDVSWQFVFGEASALSVGLAHRLYKSEVGGRMLGPFGIRPLTRTVAKKSSGPR